MLKRLIIFCLRYFKRDFLHISACMDIELQYQHMDKSNKIHFNADLNKSKIKEENAQCLVSYNKKASSHKVRYNVSLRFLIE